MIGCLPDGNSTIARWYDSWGHRKASNLALGLPTLKFLTRWHIVLALQLYAQHPHTKVGNPEITGAATYKILEAVFYVFWCCCSFKLNSFEVWTSLFVDILKELFENRYPQKILKAISLLDKKERQSFSKYVYRVPGYRPTLRHTLHRYYWTKWLDTQMFGYLTCLQMTQHVGQLVSVVSTHLRFCHGNRNFFFMSHTFPCWYSYLTPL